MRFNRVVTSMLATVGLLVGLASPAAAVDQRALDKGLRHLKEVEAKVPDMDCTYGLNLNPKKSFKRALELRTGFTVPMTDEELIVGLNKDKASREQRIKDYSQYWLQGSGEWEGDQSDIFEAAAAQAGAVVIAKAHECNFIKN